MAHHDRKNLSVKNNGNTCFVIKENNDAYFQLFLECTLKNFFSGCEVCDYGDIEFDYLPDSQDPPMFHIKHPKTNGMMARKVLQISPTVFLPDGFPTHGGKILCQRLFTDG